MKVVVRLILIFTVGGLTVLIAQKQVSKKNKNIELHERINIMPEFKYTLVSDTPDNNGHSTSLANVIGYFNTHCQFCQHEIKDILECQHLFNKTQFLFVSDQPFDTLINFSLSNGIDSISSINIGQVDYLSFTDCFGEVIPPTTFIYDSNNSLISNYKGQIRAIKIADDIKKHYRKIEPN